MLVKVTYLPVGDDMMQVVFSFGEKAPLSPSYIMASRGVLEMPKGEWAAMREILTRGAKRPTMVVIEQAG